MDKKLPKFVGTINIPGDKSISHRALIIGSQATGIVKVTTLKLKPVFDCEGEFWCQNNVRVQY